MTSNPYWSDAALEMIAHRFKLLSEPSRLRLLYALRHGAMTVGELTALTGMTQANVSHQLNLLADGGLVTRSKSHLNVWYALADPSLVDLYLLVCRSLQEQGEFGPGFNLYDRSLTGRHIRCVFSILWEGLSMRPVQKFMWIGITVLVVLIVLGVLIARRSTAQTPPHESVESANASIITVTRQLTEVTEEVPGTIMAVQHADISPKVMSRIADVYVREGDHVAAGQLLAKLEGKDLQVNVDQASAGVLNAEAVFQQAKTGWTMQKAQSAVAVLQAQAALLAAQAQLAKAKQGPRPEQVAQADEAVSRAKAGLEQTQAGLALVKEGARSQQKLQADQAVLAAQGQVSQAEAGLATAKAGWANAQADYDRMNNLYKQDIVPKQRLDHMATQLEAMRQAVKQAEAGVAQAKAGVEMAKAQSSLVYAGARTQEVIAAEKQVEQAQAMYEQAKHEATMAHQGGRWEDVKQAEEGVKQAEAGLRAAQAAQARDQVSEKDVTRAAAGIAQAKAGLSGAQTMAGYTAIYAPFSGVITGRKADPGTMAMPQMPIISMDDDRVYQLVSQAPERLAAKLTVGKRVMVRIDALNITLPATITQVVPSADPASRTLTVKANLPSTSGVQSGLFGRLAISTGSEMQLTVPSSAVVEKNGLTGVFVIDETKTARYTLVTLGARSGDRVQVLSGLQDGQRIAASHADRLVNGARIEAEGGAR